MKRKLKLGQLKVSSFNTRLIKGGLPTGDGAPGSWGGNACPQDDGQGSGGETCWHPANGHGCN